jgi:hypothetical protein
MALTIVKKAAKAKAAAKVSATAALESVAEAYAEKKLELEAKQAKLAALSAEVESAESYLLELVEERVGVAEPLNISAGPYVVKVGPRGKKAIKFDNELIKTEVGAEVFDALATFKIEDLKKYMTGHTFEQAVTYANVNKRKVVIEEVKDSA